MSSRPLIALICVADVVVTELSDHLDRRGYDVHTARQPWEAETLLGTGRFDVVLVGDVISPEAGRNLLRRFGGESGPYFVLICRPMALVDKVLALELGAADVVESPLVVREMATRIGGLVARRRRSVQELLVLENATVDLRSALVMRRNGEEEQLSPGQIALLRLFMANPRTVLTRDDIIAAAPAESSEAFDRSIDSRIVRLRRKLDTEAITTIRGAGYRFDPPAQMGGGSSLPESST